MAPNSKCPILIVGVRLFAKFIIPTSTQKKTPFFHTIAAIPSIGSQRGGYISRLNNALYANDPGLTI